MRKQISKLLGCAALTVLVGTSAPAAERSIQAKYPIVFETGNELKVLGIALTGFGKQADVKPFKHQCYYYGDGSNFISVSDEFLNRYLQRGFSLNSLCLALQSPLAFDPETGKRLPSYMVADLEAVRKKQLDAGSVSEVLPLLVPDCFKRGLPYHDCKFRFDMQKGTPLPPGRLAVIMKGKNIFDQKMAEIKRNGAYATECKCEESNLQPGFSTTEVCRLEKVPKCAANDSEHLIVGTLRAEGYQVFGDFGESGITLVDISPSLPLGYGYQLHTDGAAAPEGGDPKTAGDPSRRVNDAVLKDVRQQIFGIQ
jgi:hypothetical protein